MATRIKPAVQTVELRTGMRHRTLLGDAVRRFARNRLAMLGLLIVLFLLFLAVFADVIAPYPYDKTNFSVVNLLPFVNPAYPLGADAVGRDYLSRLIYGARTSMLIGLSVPLIGFTIGITLGVLAGFYGGRFDMIVQRLVEIFTAVILVLALTSWIEPTRLTRAQFLTFREKEFVSAARALGATDLRLVLAHVLPNALTPLLVAFTFAVPTAIFAEAGLSFLGIGITEPTASWGKMVGNSVGSTIRIYYHLALFPTLLVALTMLGFSFVGDGLQEALDPSRTR
jgi:oligopeptide transport system permease protein